MPPLLLLSNGHGEDACASAWGAALAARGLDVEALPLVGEGRAFAAAGLRAVGPRVRPPSGGFGWGRPGALLQDLRAGLLAGHLAQGRFLRAGARAGRWEAVLAVGDVFPLALAAGSGLPFGFYGAFQSDFYRPDARSAFHPLDRRFLRRARLVAARDPETAAGLRTHGLDARCLGNLMMDGLAHVPPPPADGPAAVALLPGSRAPEALANLDRLLRVASALGREAPLTAHVAWALEEAVPDALLRAHGLAPAGAGARESGPLPGPAAPARWENGAGLALALHPRDFAGAIAPAAFVLAMAGTAVEQAAGLGRPAVSLAGRGPQCTPGFVRAQGRLLGEAVAPCFGVEEAIAAARRWRHDDAERARRAEIGRSRMGPPGAALRLADAWLERRP